MSETPSHTRPQDRSQKDSAHGGHDMSAMLESNERALKVSSVLTGVYFFIELGLGIYSGSVAVLSDALHTFSAVGGVLLALVAGRIAARPADRYRTYGSMRAEIIGALFNGLFLFLMALMVIYAGVKRLAEPVEIQSGLMLAAAGGGLITEIISMKLLFSGQKGNLNMKGAFWHIVQTFVGSLIIILAAVIIRLTGFLAIDPILGIAFGLALILAAWGITRDSLRVLMETVPAGIDVLEISDAVTEIEGVEDVHHVHAWALTSGKNLFSAHVLIDSDASHEQVLTQSRQVLKTRFGFYFSTLQVEQVCEGEEDAAAIDFADSRAKVAD
jgi:cobalt-zinc-cadmium efflux system protein